jgi:molecular chaperone GrpE
MMDENQDTNMNRDQNQEEEMQPTEQNPVESDGRSGGAEFAARLEACEAKANEYLEGWQRSRAEFSNYKKRIDRDQSLMQQSASTSIIKRYLEPLDDLERALKNRPQEGEGAAWASGIELIYRKMLNILESEGVERIQAQGQYFDPNLHEAVTSEDSDEHESGQIIDVLQQGYMVGERVLRPAMVRVAR